MTINDYIHVLAGTLITISLVLGAWVNPYWYLLAAFVGINLFQYGFTKFCPMAIILKKLDVPETSKNLQ
jgi:hypothetical protein